MQEAVSYLGQVASECAGRGRYLIVPPSVVQQIVGLVVFAIDVRSKKPGVQLALMRNLLLFLRFAAETSLHRGYRFII
jgi:hypothetical protein